MTRSSLAMILVAAWVVGLPAQVPAGAQDTADLAGRWKLNRELSQLPRDVGFGADWVAASTGPGGGTSTTESGGRGRRGSSGNSSGGFTTLRESEDDAKRAKLLTADVRLPPEQLSIAATPSAVTITDDRERSRTFHPTGKEEVLQLDGGIPVGVTTKREAGHLVVSYNVEQGRTLRYTYSRTPSQLVVDVQFIEHSGGDTVRRVYDNARALESLAATSTAAAPAPAPGKPGAAPSSERPPAQGAAQAATLAPDTRPDAPLRGLTQLGLVVEELSSQAAACGLNQAALETAASRRLTDAGFKILRNSDEDSYVYVNIITSSASGGLCVSRYDVFLYTHTTAKLSYQAAPVLVEVSLLHKGGIAGGSAAAHPGSRRSA